MKMFLLVILVIILYKLISNAFYLYKTKSLFAEYERYIKSLLAGEKYQGNIIYKQNEIVRLFKRAGVKDSVTPRTVPLGFGYVSNQNISTFVNLFTNEQNVLALAYKSFQTAIGEYRSRMINSFNPIYWIDLIIYLPKHFLEYVGFNSDKISNLFQAIYWLVSAVITILKIVEFF